MKIGLAFVIGLITGLIAFILLIPIILNLTEGS